MFLFKKGVPVVRQRRARSLVTSALPADSLRTRRRQQLVAEIQQAAHRLFADRGFDEVTTEEIAAAAGVSLSTYYRYAPTKEGLLIEPVVAAVSGVVARFAERPFDEPLPHALISAIIKATLSFDDENVRTWRQAVLTAPMVLSRASLMADEDRNQLVKLVAQRMDADAAQDKRPVLLVHTMLATSQFVFLDWLLADPTPQPALGEQLQHALHIVSTGQWTE
jgi:AcrR family transcriptional regulator